MPTITIIVPCFNVERPKLLRCVNSIVDQNWKDWELRIIDDGSLPQYREAIIEAADLDDRIKVKQITNHGVSYARNLGIIEAESPYLAFIDADDEVYDYFLEEAITTIRKTDADMIVGGVVYTKQKPAVVFHSDEFIEIEPNDFKRYCISEDNLMRFDQRTFVGRGPVARVVSTEKAKKSLFHEQIKIGEDIIWNLQLLKEIKKLIVFKNTWYVYYINNESVTHKYNPQIVDELEKQLNEILKNIDLSKNVDLKVYSDHIFEELNKVDKLFLSSRDKISEEDRKRITQHLYHCRPWSYARNKRYLFLADGTHKLKWLLYMTGNLFWAWDLKRKLKGH